jgi:competence protein ComEA
MHSLLRYRGYLITSLVWIIILGLYIVYDRWPRPEAIVIETPSTVPSATVGLIVIQVTGAVHTPGIYRLPSDARSQQAIEAAGGLLPDANADGLNLAARLADGQQVYVPRVGETPPQPPASPKGTFTAIPGAGNLVNLNTATVEQLDALPCIGPVLAQRIMAYREANGPFKSLQELDQVDGIGPACIEKLRSSIVIN